MAQTDLVSSKCVGRRTVNIMMKEKAKWQQLYRLTSHWHIQGSQSLFPRV
jgi:hypothetical protein